MGTINYGTSDYITLGLRPYDSYELKQDPEFIEALDLEYFGSEDEAIDSYINGCEEDDYINITHALSKYYFWYFHVVVKPGYYEGFYIDIENNFGIAYDSWEDKREAQKEITQIKQFLTECAGLGLVQCFPGWCMGYSDYSGTIEGINNAVKAMREEVKTTPTWAQYMRDCGEAI